LLSEMVIKAHLSQAGDFCCHLQAMHKAKPLLGPLSYFVTRGSRVCKGNGHPACTPQDIRPRECSERSPAQPPLDYGLQVHTRNVWPSALVKLRPGVLNDMKALTPRCLGPVHETLKWPHALQKCWPGVLKQNYKALTPSFAVGPYCDMLNAFKAAMIVNHSDRNVTFHSACHAGTWHSDHAHQAQLHWVLELYLRILLNFHRMFSNLQYRNDHVVRGSKSS
jgi:hypothetical protein